MYPIHVRSNVDVGLMLCGIANKRKMLTTIFCFVSAKFTKRLLPFERRMLTFMDVIYFVAEMFAICVLENIKLYQLFCNSTQID